ncbi:CAPS2 protein, partial [Atractosteus spatula]|nr:CAPS2 protein [Atractosteus spatula]
MSKQDLKIVTFNVNGVLNPIKRSKILSKMKKEGAHIAFLQDTHLSVLEHEKLRRMGFSKIYFSSYKSGHRRGVAILISQKVQFELLTEVKDKEGRYVLVLTLLNVYAPPGSDFNFYIIALSSHKKKVKQLQLSNLNIKRYINCKNCNGVLYKSEEIQNTFANYYRKLYTQPHSESEDKMDTFLESLSLPTLMDDQNNILSATITPEEFNSVITSLRAYKSPGTDGFNSEWYKTFRAELIPNLFFCFPQIQALLGNRNLDKITEKILNPWIKFQLRTWNTITNEYNLGEAVKILRWYCFPFGRPEGALKATLSLLERVLMKDISTPVPPDDVKKVVRKCLEKAALINYSRLTEYAKIEVEHCVQEHMPYFFVYISVDTINLGAPTKKLEDVIRLGELCIEVLQQNEEHHSEAFAWWPELMAEHAEIFWSLYAVDMDACLEAQPQDSWDSFPLFQLLNNFLRLDPYLCNGTFHKHLQDIFIPLVIRYIDLMESSIAQSIHRGFEQETWQPVKTITNNLPNVPLPKVPSLPLNLPQIPSFSAPSWMAPLYDNTCHILKNKNSSGTNPVILGLIRDNTYLANVADYSFATFFKSNDSNTDINLSFMYSNGSATSEDLFWKLDALQMFVFDLHWPEPEFAQHLEQRLKLMAGDMVEACVKRTKAAFDARMQKASKSTDYRVSPSVCTMFNVLMDAKKQCSKLCVLDAGQEIVKQWQQYHSKIDDLIEEAFKEMISLLVSKFAAVLDGVLSKLSRYDEGTLFSSFLSFTVKAAAKYVDVPKPGMDLADTYITFVRQNQDILRDKVNEEMYIEKVFDQWYTSSMKDICVWLTDRLDLQLHMYQLKTLIKIVKKTYRDFRLQGVLEGILNNKNYETIYNRLTVEEATASVTESGGLQGISMRDSDEEEG